MATKVKASKARKPISKSEMIRRMTAKKKTTGEIMSAVRKAGHTVYYSEVYRAQSVKA
jgi:hypothetical protein